MRKYIFSLAVSGLFAFTACIYAPFCTFWQGINEFAFTSGSLFGALLPLFGIAWALAFIVLRLLAIPSPHKSVLVRGREIRVSPPDIFILSCVAALWLEGSALSKGLPAVTGAPGLFDSTPRLILDTAAWLAVFALGCIVWKKALKAAVFSAAALAALSAAGLGDAWLNSRVKILVRATAAQVYKNLSFHPEENVVVVIADNFPSYVAEKVLQNQPNLAAELDGFIFLKNNLGSGGGTTWALPAIHQGAIYEGGDYLDFAEKAFSSPGSFYNLFSGTAWNTYISSLLPIMNAIGTPGEVKDRAAGVRRDASLYACFMFKFAPYGLKRFLEPIVIKHTLMTHETNEDNSWFNKTLISRLDAYSALPTAHFHHYVGTHVPYRYDGEGKPLPPRESQTQLGIMATGEWELRCFINFLKALKERHMYDGATIVLAADHGDMHHYMRGEMQSFYMPLLMIKPRNNSGGLYFSGAPTSSAQLPKLVNEGHKGGQALKDFLATLPPERKVFLPPDGLWVVSGIEPEEGLAFKTQKIDARQTPTKLLIGSKYSFMRAQSELPLAVPFETSRDVNLAGGAGITIAPPANSFIKLLAESPPGEIDISITSIYYNFSDSPRPVSLIITDAVSGGGGILYEKEGTLPENQTSLRLDFTLRGVSVSKDGIVDLQFNCKPESSNKVMYLLETIILNEPHDPKE